MNPKRIIEWLLEGDVSIQYQVQRDLLDKERKDLQERIAQEGWGAAFLAERNPNGHWGKGFYQPKWKSSHYTILDLRNLCISPENELIQESIFKILEYGKGEDGGINPEQTIAYSDVCVNGMILNYASYFQMPEEKLVSIVDFLLSQKMSDGGFNCRSNRSGARHSSMHSTISVLEGMTEYEHNGYAYRLDEIKAAIATSKEFLLMHHLYKSDHTWEIIHKDFLRFSYPSRWKYDILRALDYFQYSKTEWDDRMKAAVEVLLEKRNVYSTWNLQSKYPGQTHFDMEKAGKPSRWNTLRAMRVLKFYIINYKEKKTNLLQELLFA
jgi:hypothetical protein